MFYLSVLDQKKIPNLMREGGKKKTFRKRQAFNLFSEKEKLMRATKKNIGQISGKVNEGDEIKKDPF